MDMPFLVWYILERKWLFSNISDNKLAGVIASSSCHEDQACILYLIQPLFWICTSKSVGLTNQKFFVFHT